MASNIHGLNHNSGGSGNRGGGGFGGIPGANGGGSGDQASCTEKMKSGWEAIPWFNKFILSSCLVIYMISWVLPQIIAIFILIPYFVMNLQVWRIITGTFVHTDLMNLLFSVISYIPSAIQEENQIGTVPFAVKFWKLSIFINFFYSLVSIILGMVGFTSVMQMPTMGLWPILMCDLVIQCMQQPDMPRGLCCLPIQIPSKWYPLVLIGIFSLFFGPQFSLFAGLGVGYLWVFGYVNFLQTSAADLKKWEGRWPFKSYKDSPSFRGNQSSLSNDPPQSSGSGGMMSSFFGGGNSSGTATERPPSGQASQPQEESKSSFSAFKGKGVSLGTGDLESSSRSRTSSASTTQSQASVAPKKTAAQIQKEREERAKAIQQQIAEKNSEELKMDQITEEVDLIGLETDDAKKKASDNKGDYKQVANNNSQYQMDM